MAVQQGVATPGEFGVELLRTRPDEFLDQIIDALAAAGCQDVMRSSGPDSQVV